MSKRAERLFLFVPSSLVLSVGTESTIEKDLKKTNDNSVKVKNYRIMKSKITMITAIADLRQNANRRHTSQPLFVCFLFVFFEKFC